MSTAPAAAVGVGVGPAPAGVFQLPSHREPPQTTVRECCKCHKRTMSFPTQTYRMLRNVRGKKRTAAYQIWSKSVNLQLRYWGKAIFNMAAVCHLEFAKIAVWSRELYLHVILHLHSKFRINQPMQHRDITKKRFSIWRPSAILNLLWRHHIAPENCILCSQLYVKVSRHSVAYFLKYLVFHVSAFWLEITFFGLDA